MAAKVILLPQKSKQNRTELELLIRKWLTEISSDDELKEYVTQRMLLFIDQYANQSFEPVFNLPALPNCSQLETEELLRAIHSGVKNTAYEVGLMVNRIIVERFFLEIEIYKCRKSSQPLLVLK